MAAGVYWHDVLQCRLVGDDAIRLIGSQREAVQQCAIRAINVRIGHAGDVDIIRAGVREAGRGRAGVAHNY
jgi:hypothetical protein